MTYGKGTKFTQDRTEEETQYKEKNSKKIIRKNIIQVDKHVPF
jgi:hypothetical protein